MLREIKKKKWILDNRKPYDFETLRLFEEMDRVDWIYSSLKLEGRQLKKSDVERISGGEFLVEIPVNDHAAISNYLDAIKEMRYMGEMKISLDKKYLKKIHEMLFPEEEEGYRSNNPILRMLSYNPPHFHAIEEQLDLLFSWLSQEGETLDPVEQAACLHNRLIEIYPFEVGTEATARAAAQYTLLSHGLPPAAWNLSEMEYYDALRLYLKKEDISPIRDVLVRGVYNKLEVMLQMTATE